jgi:hypothetical protein
MSAIGLPAHRIAPRIISAHADYRHSDFFFLRTQSQETRDAPWERRLRPRKTWSELGSYAGVALGVVIVATALI